MPDFYCHKRKPVLEIDSDVHKLRKYYDDYRNEYIKTQIV